MNKKTVFEFDSYKKFMSYKLLGQQQRGQLTSAAKALGCQRSYLSRVISDKLQITSDHAFNLARFWHLQPDERNYFQTLVELERSSDRHYQDFLKKQLIELKKRHESIQERTNRTDLKNQFNDLNYFSSWIYSAIHFLTCIPDFQTVPAIASRLNLSEMVVLNYLTQLEEHNCVEKNGNSWIYKSGEFHIPKNSPLVVLHHQNWRFKAVLDTHNFDSNGVHYTGVHTLSKSDFQRLKELLLNFISEAATITGPSKPEEAIAMTLDLFSL